MYPNYFIEGVGTVNVDPKHLPKETGVISMVALLDLHIIKIEPEGYTNAEYWVQKNYKSGTVRVIVSYPVTRGAERSEATTFTSEHHDGEPTTEEVGRIKATSEYTRAVIILGRASEIISLQRRLDQLWFE